MTKPCWWWKLPNHLKIKFVVDSDSAKIGKTIGKFKILNTDILKRETENQKIIIIPSGEMAIQIKQKLLDFGYNETNFCQFNDLLVSWFFFYEKMIFAPMISFHITTHCSLKCKGCIEFVPRITNKINIPIEKVLTDIDTFFNNVDHVREVTFSAGETFLYPYLEEVLNHIYSNYQERFSRVVVLTNGTIIPQDKICRSLTRDKCKVIISDYSHEIGDNSKIEKIVQKFSNYNIDFLVLTMFSSGSSGMWQDFGDPNKSRNRTSEELQFVYRNCSDYCKQMKDKKIYTCSHQFGAFISGIATFTNIRDSDYIDLSQNQTRNDVVSFFLQYQRKGYIHFCNFCDGVGHIVNKNPLIPSGEQLLDLT